MASSFKSYSEYGKETFPASEKLYDVFINYRGTVVKQSLASALYDSLEENGFWTFLDVEELELGDPIEPAIRNAIYSSKVQIAIFSPRYAESPWCLDELLLMLQTKAPFIPIFCDVNPSDLRYPLKGVYAPALARYREKGRFGKNRLQQWTYALHSSSLFSGYEFSTSNDNVEMLCAKIPVAVKQAIGKTSMGFPRDVEASKDEKCVGADSAASTSTSALAIKKSILLPRDSHPVAIDSKVQDMVRLIEDPKIPVIAVVGMGGLGKTFLLQNVYNKTKSTFDISIWLSISKSYSIKSLQHDIAFQLGLKGKIVFGAVSEETAAQLIHKRLQGKRCLIVLDDLWELSAGDSLLDKLGLPCDENCKVVVTTRSRDVAQVLYAHIYEIRMLSDEESWELFRFYAYPDSEALPQLEEVSREIVVQCGGLPLAIKTVAASLAISSDTSEWESKRDQLKRASIPYGEHDQVMDIVKLSYDSLPQHLKPCFAYFSFFPEDTEIDCEYLVYLWIAEGFVPAGEQQWDMAWDWLHQLHQLCLIQLWENLQLDEFAYSVRLTKHCKIHDLLHDLAIRISRQNKSAFSVEEDFTHTSGWRRILLAKKDIRTRDLSHNTPAYPRTLSLSQNLLIRSIPENLFNAMRGLRVLDLSSTDIYTLPDSVGKMIFLEVLNLRNTAIQEVPNCVRYLKRLIFLALPIKYMLLPVWINELNCLQHLEFMGVVPEGIYNIASLRTLRSGITLPVQDDLTKMTQLQEVRLEVKNDMELLIVAHLVNLRRMEVNYFIFRMKPLRFPESMKAMKHLEVLKLNRFAVPSCICDLATLRELTLQDCVYSDFPEFERMPNLVRLDLNGNVGCKELSKGFGKPGGFQRLRFLRISTFTELEQFPRLEKGSMPCLEKFELSRCKNLKSMKKVGEILVEGLEGLKLNSVILG